MQGKTQTLGECTSGEAEVPVVKPPGKLFEKGALMQIVGTLFEKGALSQTVDSLE